MILGIAGQLESGKGAVSEILEKKHRFHEIAFAGNLKEMCRYAFQLDLWSVYTTEGKKQRLGFPLKMNEFNLNLLLKWIDQANGWKVDGKHVDHFMKFINREFYTVREILQVVGTEMIREAFDHAFHAKIVFQRIEKEKLGDVVISDARFKNERNLIRQHGGKNILVRCLQQTEHHSDHKSENDLGDPEDYDYVIVNDKTKGLSWLEEHVGVVLQPELK